MANTQQTTIDAITAHFADSCAVSCDVNTASPRIEFFKAGEAHELGVGRNLEYRDNFQIVRVSGIDELADIELTTSQRKYKGGATIRNRRQREKTISVTVKICPCDCCDIYMLRRELYEIVNCEWCEDETCDGVDNCLLFRGDDDEQCLFTCNVRDPRYCTMRVRCCGVVRDVSFVREGEHEIERIGKCEYHTFTFLQPDPNLYFPQQQSLFFTFDKELAEATCAQFWCGDSIDFSLQNLRQCVTIPYDGNVIAYPRITIAGSATNPRITNVNTGASVTLENRGNFVTSGCGVTVLDFQRGQQEYRDGNGRNIYADLATGCNNQFAFTPNCPQGIELCIEAQSVNADAFSVTIEWWTPYDGFVAGRDEGEIQEQ